MSLQIDNANPSPEQEQPLNLDTKQISFLSEFLLREIHKIQESNKLIFNTLSKKLLNHWQLFLIGWIEDINEKPGQYKNNPSELVNAYNEIVNFLNQIQIEHKLPQTIKEFWTQIKEKYEREEREEGASCLTETIIMGEISAEELRKPLSEQQVESLITSVRERMEEVLCNKISNFSEKTTMGMYFPPLDNYTVLALINNPDKNKNNPWARIIHQIREAISQEDEHENTLNIPLPSEERIEELWETDPKAAAFAKMLKSTPPPRIPDFTDEDLDHLIETEEEGIARLLDAERNTPKPPANYSKDRRIRTAREYIKHLSDNK